MFAHARKPLTPLFLNRISVANQSARRPLFTSATYTDQNSLQRTRDEGPLKHIELQRTMSFNLTFPIGFVVQNLYGMHNTIFHCKKHLSECSFRVTTSITAAISWHQPCYLSYPIIYRSVVTTLTVCHQHNYTMISVTSQEMPSIRQ